MYYFFDNPLFSLFCVEHILFEYRVSSSIQGFPSGSDSKESACNAGDLGWEDTVEK